MAKSIYRKLTGRARRLEGYSQLWLAPDHLLLLRSTRFREHYWRFALADIQAIVITDLPSRLPLQTVLAAVSAGWMLIALAVSFWLFKGFFLATGGIAMASVILDIARGPGCRCYLHTAVSRELLTPVNRMRTARAVLAQLRPAIEAVQGSIPMEQLPAFDERVFSPPATAAPPEIAAKPSYLPEVVFGVFLVNAAFILLSVLLKNRSQVSSFLVSSLPGELVLAAVALFRRSKDPRRYIFLLIGVALLGIGWDFIELCRVFVHWFQQAAEAGARGRPAPMSILTDSIFTRDHAFEAAAWRTAAAAIGFALARFERRVAQPQAAPVAVPEIQ